MGNASGKQSVATLSAVELGEMVASLGGSLQKYQNTIVDNAISGDIIATLEQNEIEELLGDLNISPLHARELTNKFMELKKISNVTSSVELEIPSEITQSPRWIMDKILVNPGIHVDPTDLDPAIDKLSKMIGTGTDSDGVDKFDCYISYRVASDSDLAEKFYLYLRTKGLYPYLDKKILKNGEKFVEGFGQCK